jgi:hypothetical protein
MMSNQLKKETRQTEASTLAKKPYRQPLLQRYGSVGALTQSGSLVIMESMFAVGMA